jgi:heat shock protein HslJ
VPAGATASIVFKADGSLELNPGCNRGGGTWKLQGSGIEISGIVLTKMACQGPGGQLEGAVLQALGSGQLQATIEADVLTLRGAGGGLQLRGA